MKTKYVIPALIATFALTIVLAAPYVLAEPGMDKPYGFHDGPKMHAKFMGVQVEGFVGNIPITEDTDKQTLKDQVTVSLSEAAKDLDVVGGHIGIAVNENGEKYLAWILTSIDKDPESDTATITTYVVDAGDASNTTQVTKEIDFSMIKERKHHDGMSYSDKAGNMWEKFSQPTGNAEFDALRAQFAEKLQELKQAMADGDSDKVQELHNELSDLKNQINDLRNSQ